MDMLPVRYYPEYQWLVDISLCALVVYIVTEFYVAWFPQQKEINLSVLWCLLVIFFSLKLMFSLTAMYFSLEDHGEKVLCLTFGFFFLVFSMGCLIIREDMLDLGLETAHENFSANAISFLAEQGIHSYGPASLTTFKLVLAFVSAFVGAFITFPGLRLAKMHTDALRYAKERPFRVLALHVNFVLPLLLALLWIRPAVKDHLTASSENKPTPIMSEDEFHTMRLWSVVLFCAFRFALTILHLQAHLNMAYDRAQKLKREAGRITNTEYKKMITHVFYYLCVVTLQYLAPLILLLYTALSMKTLGGLSWAGFLDVQYPTKNVVSAVAGAANGTDEAASTVAYLSMSFARLRGVFTPVWYHGIFSYFTWWILVCWSVTSVFGLLYHAYFQA